VQGLDLDGAQQFWESHFTKLISHDQFVKSYAYSFRHMYGKEGARKNYTPYSCMKIIMGAPPEAGAHHGCPYRHAPDNQLTALLSSLKLGATDVSEIAALAKSSNYQLACQKHFDVTHPGHLNMPELKVPIRALVLVPVRAQEFLTLCPLCCPVCSPTLWPTTPTCGSRPR
jgi:DNA primase large subunit